jgi:hypothetical protein
METAARDWSGRLIGKHLRAEFPKVETHKLKKGYVWIGVKFTQAAMEFVPAKFPPETPILADWNHGLTEAVRKELAERAKPIRTVF